MMRKSFLAQPAGRKDAPFFARASLALFAFASLAVSAQQKIPPLTGPVMDDAGVLNASDAEGLAQQLRSYLPTVQEQIWIVPSLEGEAIEQLSIRAAEAWKLGTAKEDNGLIILVAIKDRQMRIEVGGGLEGLIPDALAGRIVDNVLKPAFRAGAYAAGLSRAADALHRQGWRTSRRRSGGRR